MKYIRIIVVIVLNALYLQGVEKQPVKDDPLHVIREEWHQRYQEAARECNHGKRSECLLIKQELQLWVNAQSFDILEKKLLLEFAGALKKQ